MQQSPGLSAFTVDGLEFTLGYWISDPENGQLNLRSDVNLAVLRGLRSHGIRMPPPQRPTADFAKLAAEVPAVAQVAVEPTARDSEA